MGDDERMELEETERMGENWSEQGATGQLSLASPVNGMEEKEGYRNGKSTQTEVTAQSPSPSHIRDRPSGKMKPLSSEKAAVARLTDSLSSVTKLVQGSGWGRPGHWQSCT